MAMANPHDFRQQLLQQQEMQQHATQQSAEQLYDPSSYGHPHQFNDTHQYNNNNNNNFGGLSLLAPLQQAMTENGGQNRGMKRTMSDLGAFAGNYQHQNINFANLTAGNFTIPSTTPVQKRVRALESHPPEMSPRGFGSSRYKGVCWNKKQKKWRTRLSFQGKVEFLGDFPDEETAALTYDKRIKELYGDNSKRLNFPGHYINGSHSDTSRFPMASNIPREVTVKNRVTPVGLKQVLLQQVQEETKANGNNIPDSLNTAVEETGPDGEVEVATQAHKKFLIGANRYYLGSSSYKGVCWNKKKKKWRARISNNGKREFLGDWDSEVKAAMIYDARARQLFVNVPNLRDRLNFPDGIKAKTEEQSTKESTQQRLHNSVFVKPRHQTYVDRHYNSKIMQPGSDMFKP
uniref:AP2/ERF domain-containing protein n=1 Tax=Aplanochytrium stocchinoi TaxID=215587 RepID=A0A7S3PDZ7_9STRA|mmetsp:Transcript_10111/g.11674  ORF Transcript_10111/g.11674 Transcript_10111/m.11674 type:complete len:404 (+) Transcript_10111:79-1290(+)|eukprot:CAMPEP_0204823954 /NCGR_PEP_ID=MMETSP1346-20131115/2029_1 /ASSEMBLY_ACC=CAM_ASM_000771 /TAXON_ID=215587 /ORGANISM="Aplanochytrium stocchinoi, Strain GSBS06" /LENGTH=403 /DNA_ID=CAMNT_0051950857 /DNA_START=204 /DNA_END=1415 /DNA_ORIENTATION=+